MRCRSLPTLIALLTCATLGAQFSDDLTDGDFTTAPAWSGSDALFVVTDDAGNNRLRSNSPGAANYYLSTPSSLVNDAQWEFFFDLRFSTSGANYVDVYLMSDMADLSAAVNGYYLRCGGTNDRLELFSSESGSGFTTGLVSPDGIIGGSSSNPFRIKVTRTAAGNWTLFYDDGATGTYTTAGSITDNTTTSATHFGVRIEQSGAVSVPNNHLFDDFLVGPIAVDLTPPAVVSVTAVSATQVDVLFSEDLDPGQLGNYDIQPFIGVSGQILDGSNASLVHVTPATPLTSGNSYQLLTNGAQDLAGNAMPAGTPIDFSYVVPDVAEPRDVVINEIMASPSPPVGLPNAEFVELHNATTDRTFDLAGWTINDAAGAPVAFPSYVLGPGEYVVVMSSAALPLFPSITNKLGLPSLPSLNNDGDLVELRDESAVRIDAVTYTLSWYQDAIKDDGGWTLEQIDPTDPCSDAGNWRASNATPGGTPGAQNSIYAILPDNTPPALVSVQVPDANSIVLTFSERMDAASIPGGGYVISPLIGVDAAVATGPNTALISLLDPLVVGTVYTLEVSDVLDCAGNAMTTVNTAVFALPEPIAAGDVVINEVLYDPFGSGSDFVELYNRSSKVLSLAGLQLANVDEGVVGPGVPITSEAVLLLPGEYALICEDEFNVVNNYPQSRTERFVVADMPSFNNGEGSVVFLDGEDNLMDRFDYNDDLHFALVNNTEGYSLERVDPERPASDNTNWQTAADIAGRATPGFVNSQYSETSNEGGNLTIEPAIFSPDNDGFQDVLNIAYSFNEPGYVGNLVIYDIAGRESRRLMESMLLGTEGAISWNGILDSGNLARMGPYIVVLEVFDLDGDVQKFKKTVTLAHRLD